PGCGTDAHEPAGVESKGAERTGALDDLFGLMDIEPRRRKGDFERQARFPGGATRSVRQRERPTRPLALIGLFAVAIEADLNGPNGEASKPVGEFAIELLPICFDLEANSRVPE